MLTGPIAVIVLQIHKYQMTMLYAWNEYNVVREKRKEKRKEK